MIIQQLNMASTPHYTEWRETQCYGADFRPLLKEMADTIDKLELWDWFKNEKPPADKGYMYWGHENVDKISNNLPSNPHSGATFGFAMRCMQAIAKQGFNKWNKQQD
tara:strand:+ start:8449 stop:8769 length:321 start_codon:yes stop_codon:yes gene_type:complete